MKVALIGAYDRNNLGDLLMPMIFERQYRNLYGFNSVQFEHYGLADSNMERLKDFSTLALSKMK